MVKGFGRVGSSGHDIQAHAVHEFRTCCAQRKTIGHGIWGFTKIRDPFLDPQTVGFSFSKDPKKVPPNFGNPRLAAGSDSVDGQNPA